MSPTMAERRAYLARIVSKPDFRPTKDDVRVLLSLLDDVDRAARHLAADIIITKDDRTVVRAIGDLVRDITDEFEQVVKQDTDAALARKAEYKAVPPGDEPRRHKAMKAAIGAICEAQRSQGSYAALRALDDTLAKVIGEAYRDGG